jgi:hypothetical protein
MEEQKAKREKYNETRRKKNNKPRRKREPGTPAHVSSTKIKEVQAMVQEMNTFFKDKFVSKQGNRILVQDILNLFVSSRDTTTDYEKNLFKRHAKKLFLAVWSEARYSVLKTKYRCQGMLC